MDPTLQWSAKHEQQEGKSEGNCYKPPVTQTAHDPDACGKPDARRTGEALHSMLFGMDDYAGAEKADAGQNSLDNATRCV